MASVHTGPMAGFEEVGSMAYLVPPVGLCISCNNFATCYHRKRRGFDAIYCEMFDASTPTEASGQNHIAETLLPSPDEPVASGDRVLNDLCINCANRDTCLFPKSKGGVWHCEEYL